MEFSKNNGNHPLNNKQPLPFLMDHLPPTFREKAETELHETEERRLNCTKELREMIKGEETLDDIEFHSDYLQQILRHSKYDVEKALNRLRNSISSKRNHNPLFNTITDETFEKVKSANIINVLPWRTPDGCAVLIVKYGNWDTYKINFDELNCYTIIILQQCLRDPMTQINGFTFIHDCRNMTLRTMRQFTPMVCYDSAKVYLDCIPARYTKIHVINYPVAFKIVWAIIKSVMSEKLRGRVVLSPDQKDLLNYIHPSAMPVEYGGYLNQDESTISDWLKKAFVQQKHCPLGGQCNYYTV